MLNTQHRVSRNSVIREMDATELADLIESIYEKARRGDGMRLTPEDGVDLRLAYKHYEQLTKIKY